MNTNIFSMCHRFGRAFNEQKIKINTLNRERKKRTGDVLFDMPMATGNFNDHWPSQSSLDEIVSARMQRVY